MQAKQNTFRGLAQYYQAQACRASKAVGEEIARLTLAAELLKGARPGSPAADAAVRAARQLQAAVRDNDFIYHARVPDAHALEPISRAPIAKALALPPRWGSAPDLFERLVPMQVHQALMASEARRADLVGAEINKLREATQLLNRYVPLCLWLIDKCL